MEEVESSSQPDGGLASHGARRRGPRPCARRAALSVADDSPTPTAVDLAVEEPLEIRLDGEPYAVVMRTPGHELELAAGFCLTEGIVDSFDEVLSIAHCRENENVVDVHLAGGRSPRRERRRTLPSRSSCGLCGVRLLADVERTLSPLSDGPSVALADLARLPRRMAERQGLWRVSAGSHAAVLARSDGEVLALREDVGRHNALDKVIGCALLRGMVAQECVALLSGRISFEMVQKTARARIPILAAVSAATSTAVDLAERLNLTLVGRLRGATMTVYTHPARLLGL